MSSALGQTPDSDSVAPKAPDDAAKATTRSALRSPQPMLFETHEMRYERQKPKPKRPCGAPDDRQRHEPSVRRA
ncbi:hypothetical protein S7711_10935 [Stachybotrys chartarum IBT 7711]|uniref:Uncharacterized protein n=1 Tax=Stachybotrys chartarum (strain CBS 109288 / IBT 7711) TaxID=1280523 RepID=A0A084B967_STACB|nr:hypothetical protein S7711_10935 [Stachybotrys chartarum IBT 7711]KFA49176.1 hypothetical protein S40293_11036 [Stachybotrys chartarum IBT 40293]KFA78220.1 hypothetical protein S40288_10599 [Stachybotrys chartarum IBT 40288]